MYFFFVVYLQVCASSHVMPLHQDENHQKDLFSDFATNSFGESSSFENNYSKQKRDTRENDSLSYETKLTPFRDKSLVIESDDFKIEVKPFISSIYSSSVIISLQYDVMRRNFSDAMKLFDYIRVRVSYRPFGNFVEEEKILMIRNVTANETVFNINERYIKTYQIDNLHSNTGYIFCFSLLKLNNTYATYISSNAENTHSTSLKNNNTITDRHKSINSDKAKTLHSFYNNSDSDESPLSFQISEMNSNTQSHNRNRTNYVYTSTGELIYLPLSSWRPHKHRNPRFKRSDVKIDSKYCIEVKTSKENEIFSSSFIILVIVTSFLGFILLNLILFVIFRKLCNKKKIDNIHKENCTSYVKNYNNASTLEKINNSSALSNAEVQTIGNSISHEGNSKTKCIRKHQENNSTLCLENKEIVIKLNQSVNSKISKRPPPLNFQKITKDENDFHPGYDIPPSSTVEAYGYDFPRRPHHITWNVTSSIPSSCELNEYISDSSSENISRQVNLNKPNFPYKQSEITKYISTSEYIKPFCNKACNTFQPDLIHSNTKICKNVSDVNKEYPNAYSCTSNYTKNNSNNINSLIALPYKKEKQMNKALNNKNETKSHVNKGNVCVNKDSSMSSLGDITITGGTLVEVSDGYAYPKSNPIPVKLSVLKITVNGNDYSN